MITSGIFFKNFKASKQNFKIKKNLKELIKENIKSHDLDFDLVKVN